MKTLAVFGLVMGVAVGAQALPSRSEQVIHTYTLSQSESREQPLVTHVQASPEGLSLRFEQRPVAPSLAGRDFRPDALHLVSNPYSFTGENLGAGPFQSLVGKGLGLEIQLSGGEVRLFGW